jgi:benzoylformate decarboxylase
MIAIHSDVRPAIDLLHSFNYKTNPVERIGHIGAAHKQMLEGMKLSFFKPDRDMRQISEAVVAATKNENVIHVFDAGDAAADSKQRIPFGPGKGHIATASGHVGFALPGGVGIAHANKTLENPPVVIIHSGDSGMHYSPAEIGFAAAHNLPVVVLAYNNHRYGAVQRSVERTTGSSKSADFASDLPMFNFGNVARGYGANGEQVSDMGDLQALISTAITNAKAGKPTVIDIPLDIKCGIAR